MKRLKDILPGDRFSFEPETLACYGFDASGLHSAPAAVAWPENTDDVSRLSRFAYENGFALCPRGAGTGTTGGAVPERGALILSFERMNRIIELDRDNMTVMVEPGIINGRLQKELEKEGLFYPPDPASMNFCTIGGNVAENAGGPRAVKYGVTRDYVMEIEGVLPDGRILHTGVRTAKGVVGYDLTRLIVGSEGTLCTITRIRLRLLPLPQSVVTLLAIFDDMQRCGAAVSAIMSAGIIPRTLELMDRGTIRAVENYRPVGLPPDAEALLLIELDGHPEAIREEAARVTATCMEGGGEVQAAESERDRERLWEARRAVSPALYHMAPFKVSEDVVVPRTRIPDLLAGLKALSGSSGINIVNFGHAGDGNIHVNIMADRKDGAMVKEVQVLVKEIFRITLELGGTISGEHGIGMTKARYLDMELSRAELDMMMGIKRLFDHRNILNPGKIFT